jgi:hypothetical protein
MEIRFALDSSGVALSASPPRSRHGPSTRQIEGRGKLAVSRLTATTRFRSSSARLHRVLFFGGSWNESLGEFVEELVEHVGWPHRLGVRHVQGGNAVKGGPKS